MHYLKINVEDNVYSHLKFFLDGLNNKGIEVVEDKIVEKNYIEQKYLFNTISIDTSTYNFDREEANER